MIGWACPLAVILADAMWTGFTKHRLAINYIGVEFAIAFGGFFFLLSLLTAVGDDIHRNWGAQERIVAWNPSRIWKTFLYVGALFFFVAAFLAYRQGVSPSVFFIAFAIGSAITAKKCF